MQPFISLIAVTGMLSLTLANDNITPRDQLFSRQSADCLPIFLEYPSASFIPCGNLYISNLCTCCPGGVLGCYSFNVCTVDSTGASLCCPAANPDCGMVAPNAPAAATTTNVAPASPATTEVFDTSPSPAAETNAPASTTTPLSMPTSTSNDPFSSPSSATSSVQTSTLHTGGASGSPTAGLLVGWQILAAVLVFLSQFM